jgi:hypothetical protein
MSLLVFLPAPSIVEVVQQVHRTLPIIGCTA